MTLVMNRLQPIDQHRPSGRPLRCAGLTGQAWSVADTVLLMLVYLYGPPASGKLTIAGRLAELSGYRLFHNHLTVNAVRSVFDFGTEPFNHLVRKLRLDVFEAAAKAGIDVIFTNNSAWGGPDGRAQFAAFADSARRLTEAGGSSAFFVRITAPLAVLEERVADESRRAHGKLLDAERLRDMVADLDDSCLYPGDLTIDTSQVTSDEAARIIAESLA
jgi:predicted kinase